MNMLECKFIKCPLCNGQGFVAWWKTKITGEPLLQKVECARCGGVGFIRKTETEEGEDNG